MLAHAARLDGVAGRPPGYLFATLSRVIGGRTADPNSHAGVSFDCLRALWIDPEAEAFRQPVSDHLVRRLTHERQVAMFVGADEAVLHHPTDARILQKVFTHLLGERRGDEDKIVHRDVYEIAAQ